MKDIAIYGDGGYGREIACLISRINSKNKEWNLVGFFDDNPILKGSCNEYGSVIGGMSELNAWKSPLSIVVAIGNPSIVESITKQIINPVIDYPNIVDPSVEFLDMMSVKIGRGNVFCARCVISCNVVIGNYNLFNVGVGIGHDVTMGNSNVFMPNVNISGGVKIGNSNLFGVKSTILQYLNIGNNVKIGAGSLLMRNGKSDSFYFGAPASKIE